MSEFVMPSLGADMTAGTLVEWRVAPGDAVSRGDVVAVVDTEKAAIEVEVWESGVVDELVVAPGTRVPVGAVLARLRPAAEGAAVPTTPSAAPAPPPTPSAPREAVPTAPAAVPAAREAVPTAPEAVPAAREAVPTAPEAVPAAREAVPAAAEAVPSAPEAVPAAREAVPAAAVAMAAIPIFRPTAPAPFAAPLVAPPAPAAGERVRASPAARRLAAERGIGLSGVTGTGPDGAVVRVDVERGVAAAPVGAEREAARPPRRRRATPVAARTAAELGIDLAAVVGTGRRGMVTRADVRNAARQARAPSGPPPAAAPEQLSAQPQQPTEGAAAKARSAAMREAIAAAVSRSKREIPHYYLWTHLDMRRALERLAVLDAGRTMEDRILPAALLLRATALALRGFPELNGFWTEDGFRPGPGIHLGVAVFLRGGGLVAPAILDADAKGLDVLMRELGGLVQRARTGGLRGAEMTSATITVTNLGDRGVEGVMGVIYPPQVAIVGFGRIVERPWAEGGMLGVRPVVGVTLAADHRASDGHRGSLFLRALDTLLQKPEEL